MIRETLRKLPFGTLCAGLALFNGLIIPSVYELELVDSSLERLALVVALLTATVCVLCGVFCETKAAEKHTLRPIRFSIRRLLVAISFLAVLMVACRYFEIRTVNCLMAVGVVSIAVWSFTQPSPIRSRVGALLAVTFLPLIWIVAYSVPIGRISGLAECFAWGAGLLPAAFARAFCDPIGVDNMPAIGACFVACQLALGIYLAIRGGITSVVYTFVVLILSSISSFGLFIGTRA